MKSKPPSDAKAEKSFTTPPDRLIPSELANSHLRSHTTCIPFFLYLFLFIVEVMLYDMEQPFSQFRLAKSLAYSMWGQSRKKKDLTLERTVQQQPRHQSPTLVWILNLRHSPIWDAVKNVNFISSRPIRERNPKKSAINLHEIYPM